MRQTNLFTVRLMLVLAISLNIPVVVAQAQGVEQKSQQCSTAQACYSQGKKLYGQNKLDEAITAYRRATDIDENFVHAYINLGIVLTEKNKLDDAINAYKKAIKLGSNKADVHSGLGFALYRKGNWEQAIEEYNKAIEIDPKYTWAYINLGIVFADQNKLDEAIGKYRRALEIQISDDPGATSEAAYKLVIIHNNLGRLLQKKGELEDAISEYKAALEIDPNYEFAQSNLKEAQRQLALKQDPNQQIALNETKYLPDDDDDPLTPIKRSIVKIIVTFKDDSASGFGTGYVIKRQGNQVWIITNRHVVVDESNKLNNKREVKDLKKQVDTLQIEPYYGNIPDGKEPARCNAEIVNISDYGDTDLALLKTTQLPNDIQPLTLDANPPSPSLPINIMDANNHNWQGKNGTFLNTNPSTKNLIMDFTLESGMSGSPILNSKQAVIGIAARSANESMTRPDQIAIGHSMNLVLQQIAKWGITIP